MVSGFLICLFVSCADSVLSLVTGKAIRLPECTSSCYSRTGLGKLIHCLSSPHEIRGLVFQGSPIFKGMSVGMTGSRTLHFMCLVCQLLSPWGPRGGGEMCFSHACTSKRFTRSCAPQDSQTPSGPRTGAPRGLYICHFRLICVPKQASAGAQGYSSCTTFPPYFQAAQREHCFRQSTEMWMWHLQCVLSASTFSGFGVCVCV